MGSIQSWESATSPEFKRRILSFTSISGPAVDYAANVFRQKTDQPLELLKVLAPSYYIAFLHIPLLPRIIWAFVSVETWHKRVSSQEKDPEIPFNFRVQRNGTEGVKLYRANITQRVSSPTPRKAICPVQAIVPDRDNYIHHAHIDEMRNWVDDFTEIHVEGAHWVLLSHPKLIANAIRDFIRATSSTPTRE